jgi:hypothetical protein
MSIEAEGGAESMEHAQADLHVIDCITSNLSFVTTYLLRVPSTLLD